MPNTIHVQGTSSMGGVNRRKILHARNKSAPTKKRKYVKKKMEYWNKKKRK
jgi:hypothetical protein